MGGFKKELNNVVFEQNLFSLIIWHISQCCKKMREDCKTTGENLYHHEDKISNRLVERHLDMNYLGLRFERETLEHYDPESDTYKGRTDITIKSSDWLKNREAYYIVEAKRLDGGTSLNKAYISEGISRFVILPSSKYPSYYGKSIMLGYVVQAIDISENVVEIDKLQRKMIVNVAIGEMNLVCDDGEGFSHYQCLYQANGNINVVLAHLFYNFSDVMCDKSSSPPDNNKSA